MKTALLLTDPQTATTGYRGCHQSHLAGKRPGSGKIPQITFPVTTHLSSTHHASLTILVREGDGEGHDIVKTPHEKPQT